jgi:mono/diheme cytochrome c family protein
MLLLLCLSLILVACSDAAQSTPLAAPPTPTTAPTPTEQPPQKIGDAEAGQHLFVESCAPCHGHNATGIEGIGFDLTTSEFVGGLTTAQLADFIIMGRSLNNPMNSSGLRMPARGGRTDLSDQEIFDIATYLHTINTKIGIDRGEAIAYLAWLEGGGLEKMEATPEINREGLAGPALDGQTTYLRFCAVCHAPHGEGVQGLGKSLIKSEFVTQLDDTELAHFITVGRPATDPLNTTGIEMLPYGGQQTLTTAELSNLVAYLRVVNTGDMAAALPSDTGETEEHEGEGTLEARAVAIMEKTTPTCFVCHRIGERGNKNGPGPNLNGIGLDAGQELPGLDARAYLKQSILEPSAFIVPECPAGPCVDSMPKNLGEQLSESEIETLLDFLLTLTEEENRGTEGE